LRRDALPSGMTPLSAVASQGTCTLAETVTCQLGALANGATATATIAVRATQVGALANTVTVSAAEFDLDSTNNTATVITTVEPRRPLTVTLTGNGEGIITSEPAGIQCAPVCQATFEAGSGVVLSAPPAANSVFAGWTG